MELVTSQGLLQLKKEEERLLEEEKEAVEAMVIARGFGDFSENAELDSAKEWLQRVRQRIGEIKEKIRNAEVFDISKVDKEVVGFGATVLLEDCETEKETLYKIVGEDESSVEEGKISFKSPIARGLKGKRKEEECEIRTPRGEKYYLVKNITYED